MMHPAMDPDIKAFRAAGSDVARAAVLLSAPIGTVMLWRENFVRMALAAEFKPGLAYLDALADAQRRRRHRGCHDTVELAAANTDLLGVIETGSPPASAAKLKGGAENQSSQPAASPEPVEGVSELKDGAPP